MTEEELPPLPRVNTNWINDETPAEHNRRIVAEMRNLEAEKKRRGIKKASAGRSAGGHKGGQTRRQALHGLHDWVSPSKSQRQTPK